MPLARITPGPESLHRIWCIKVSSAHGFTWELSPATANHDFKQQDERIYPESFIVSNAAL
jgi:hypothetical protein